tara:strand:- start:135 stop:545 length:411 start_codon:yes stop_codon:yes gene_type:complete
MDITSAFPSSWLKAADLGGREVTVPMAEVRIETVGQGTDAEEVPVLFFAGQAKGLILNKTNARSISQLYGTETTGWAGRQVTLFPTTTQFGAETRECIRIKAPAETAPAPAPAAPAPPPAPEPPATPTPPPEGVFF